MSVGELSISHAVREQGLLVAGIGLQGPLRGELRALSASAKQSGQSQSPAGMASSGGRRQYRCQPVLAISCTLVGVLQGRKRANLAKDRELDTDTTHQHARCDMGRAR